MKLSIIDRLGQRHSTEIYFPGGSERGTHSQGLKGDAGGSTAVKAGSFTQETSSSVGFIGLRRSSGAGDGSCRANELAQQCGLCSRERKLGRFMSQPPCRLWPAIAEIYEGKSHTLGDTLRNRSFRFLVLLRELPLGRDVCRDRYQRGKQTWPESLPGGHEIG